MTESVAAFDALDQEAAALSAVIRTLAPADLAASTKLPTVDPARVDRPHR